MNISCSEPEVSDFFLLCSMTKWKIGEVCMICTMHAFAFIIMSTYARVYEVFVSLLLNAKNIIKSSWAGNKFKIANLTNFVDTNYLKICFNITILFYMLFLSIKCMHSMIVPDVFFLQEM